MMPIFVTPVSQALESFALSATPNLAFATLAERPPSLRLQVESRLKAFTPLEGITDENWFSFRNHIWSEIPWQSPYIDPLRPLEYSRIRKAQDGEIERLHRLWVEGGGRFLFDPAIDIKTLLEHFLDGEDILVLGARFLLESPVWGPVGLGRLLKGPQAYATNKGQAELFRDLAIISESPAGATNGSKKLWKDTRHSRMLLHQLQWGNIHVDWSSYLGRCKIFSRIHQKEWKTTDSFPADGSETHSSLPLERQLTLIEKHFDPERGRGFAIVNGQNILPPDFEKRFFESLVWNGLPLFEEIGVMAEGELLPSIPLLAIKSGKPDAENLRKLVSFLTLNGLNTAPMIHYLRGLIKGSVTLLKRKWGKEFNPASFQLRVINAPRESPVGKMLGPYRRDRTLKGHVDGGNLRIIHNLFGPGTLFQGGSGILGDVENGKGVLPKIYFDPDQPIHELPLGHALLFSGAQQVFVPPTLHESPDTKEPRLFFILGI